MITEEHMLAIVEALTARTRNGDVQWQEAKLPASSRSVLRYTTKFPRSRIAVSFVTPDAEPDFYRLELRNEKDEAVFSKGWDINDGPAYPLVMALFEEAHRYVTQWDTTLNDVLESLELPPVDTSRPKEAKRPPSDELPF